MEGRHDCIRREGGTCTCRHGWLSAVQGLAEELGLPCPHLALPSKDLLVEVEASCLSAQSAHSLAHAVGKGR